MRISAKTRIGIFLGILALLISALFLGRPEPLGAAAKQCIWEGVERIVAVGDLHGDYENFLTILKDKDVGLIDNGLHWIGGKTHLVQIGDIMDRGDRAKEIFDLIKNLEKDAEKAGGMVHMLIGNHEEINILEMVFDYGEDYITVEQFISFLPESYKKRKEREFRKRTEGGGNINDEWKKLMKTDDGQTEYYENFNLYYGRWIAEEHNAVIKINDTVFVHGGINEKYSAMPLKDINNLYFLEFHKVFRGERFRPKILFDPEGPLWCRDLAVWNEQLYASQVNKILANLGAKQIVIAHTPEIQERASRFNYKVWLVDTGISSPYHRDGGFLSALIIENGNRPRRTRPKY